VRIWEYQPTMMHSKTMLVDDRWIAVGSTNLDPLSQRQMEEDTVVLEDEQLAGQQAKNFLEDLQYSKEIKHPPGGLLEQISRQFFWIIGRWL
jgi:cardiolipin synthase